MKGILTPETRNITLETLAFVVLLLCAGEHLHLQLCYWVPLSGTLGISFQIQPYPG